MQDLCTKNCKTLLRDVNEDLICVPCLWTDNSTVLRCLFSSKGSTDSEKYRTKSNQVISEEIIKLIL